MTSSKQARPAVPPWTLAVAAMLSVQLGSALSTHLITQVGAAGTAWLRLSFGSLIFWVIARPPLRKLRRQDVPALLGLGATTGLQTIAFLAAINRMPLGTCVAIEFLGPLTVAAVQTHHRRALAWPALALAGVVVLTQPWHGTGNVPGLAFAALAALGWASYILFTQRVGARLDGITGLSLTTPVAAVVSASFGVPQAAGHLTGSVLAGAVGLAVLLPVLPYACELIALRSMPTAAFGTLMAVEPAIGTLLGLIVLRQHPDLAQLLGITAVVIAGIASQRTQPPEQPSATADTGASSERDQEGTMICCQFIFKPGTYDDEFHRLDTQIDEHARSLPGFDRVETWTAPDTGVVNAIYYFTDKKSVAQLARYPQHREAKGQVQRWYDGYRIVISEITATYGDGRLPMSQR
ncbi:MAG: EamA family transporter [Jatrophihabitans sp.]|uniref:EamA family transporter n=1 Tax=Jatrophihabitans sp. TaxID=1932789 RepID=UPI003F7EA81E